MIVKASTVDRKGDLFKSCKKLDLRSTCDHEAKLLSALCRAMVDGGVIRVERQGVDPFVIAFDPIEEGGVS